MSEVPLHLGDLDALQRLKRFRGGLVFEAHILLYHSTLGSRVIKKKDALGISTPCNSISMSYDEREDLH